MGTAGAGQDATVVAPARAFLVVGGTVLAAALFGIATRSPDLLASFWVANALLLGVLVRWPRLAVPAGWLGAAVGYVAADLVTGSELVTTLALSLANLTGVCVGWLLLRRAPQRAPQSSRDIGWLLLVAVLASAGATVVGAPCSVHFFDSTPLTATQTWFTAELVAYVAVLPFVLCIPDHPRDLVPTGPAQWAPLVALPVGLLIGSEIGGMVGLTATLPVLVWSALQGSLGRTAALVLISAVSMMLSLRIGLLEVDVDNLTANAQVALQLGLALLGACPLFVAAATGAERRRLEAATDLARRDALTGLLNRAGFMDAAAGKVAEARAGGSTIAVVMLDLDAFKAINDEFGHAAGDALLIEVGAVLTEVVRRDDPVGRVGGEEFAVVAVGIGPSEAYDLAERLRLAVRRVRVAEVDGRPVTASVGTCAADARADTSLEELLRRADLLLYAAKRAGRDQTVADGVG